MTHKIIIKDCKFDNDPSTCYLSSDDKAFNEFITKNIKILRGMIDYTDDYDESGNLKLRHFSLEMYNYNIQFVDKEVLRGLNTCYLEFDFDKKTLRVELLSKKQEYEERNILLRKSCGKSKLVIR